MKLPAIRSHMGDWEYYVTSLTFNQVRDHVSRIDDELHQSDSLKEMIQRSITNNFISIKEYILNQPERFFNALVLAVYNDYPDWREIEFSYEDIETFSMGLLEFPGNHKIFPVDGQHRVEGIKAALLENPELGTEKVAAIFIGHKNDQNGMQKTRRLFSTLNRYAKPVTMDDIIALDEDDSVAISTRELVEGFELFKGDRIPKTETKAIPETDKNAFTSIITLYQCNLEVLKRFRKLRKETSPNVKRDKLSLKKYLKFRPQKEEIDLFIEFCSTFWSLFLNKFDVVKAFLEKREANPASEYRNRDNGGNLIFRPVGLRPLIQAIFLIEKRESEEVETVLTKLNSLDFTLSEIPWRNVLWNPNERTMITSGTLTTVKLLLIYMYNPNLLTEKELKKLKEQYADKTNKEELGTALDEIQIIEE